MPDRDPNLRCETCPFWEQAKGMHNGYCHNTSMLAGVDVDNNFVPDAGYWCSEHPLAPPTRMEQVLRDLREAVLIAAGKE